ncbi:MAG: Rne/Rng family ribonuclease [Geobacter sp.]|nr:Rne/Rng family ribonuclease [Geobacter sp.]
MAKKMLINALHPEESRVAIVDENGRLVDLDIEITGSEQMRGNIYRGVVLRVEPSLQAAFIDIGLKKPAFLQMGELHPDYWQWRDDIPEEQRKRRPRIQDVLRRGQELLVQVEKDERDMKGAAVTSYISMPGRYMVIMPGSDSTGISRKVEGEGERKKLKELVKEMTIPEGIGYIMRTEAVGRTLEELQKDLDSLVERYHEVVAAGKAGSGAAIIYKEHSVVIRTIRDYFSADIDEVLVDSKEVCKEAKAFFRDIEPKLEKRVKMHQEKRPIFSRYQIEEQIDGIYEKKVPLKSGGSLVIEPTEALVSVDVYSGKSTGERNVEETAFRTNLEAVEEAARQLRLRDLGGLIVLDLIDMREMKHIKEVEKALKDALKSDKSRVTVGRISQFGMLEMSRQRIKQTLEQGSVFDCPHCSGRGKVKGVENMAISFLRKVHAAAAKGTAAEVHGALPLEVAYYLLNRKKRELAQIENDYDIEVTIKGKPSFLMNQLELEVVKREKQPQLQQEPKAKVEARFADRPEPVEEPEVPPADEPVVDEAAAKKKRSRGKKKPVEAEPVASPVEITEELLGLDQWVDETLPESAAAANEAPAAEEAAEHVKKKRKRRRKKKGKHPESHVEDDAAEESAAEPEKAEAETATDAAQSAGEHAGDAPKKKRRRRKKRSGAKVQSEGEAAAHETIVEPPAAADPPVMAASEPATEPAAPAAKKPRARKKPAKAEAAAAVVEAVPESALEPAPAEAPPAKPRRATRAKKAAAEVPAEAPVVTVEAAVEVAPEKPKAKRAPRKKKPAEPVEA